MVQVLTSTALFLQTLTPVSQAVTLQTDSVSPPPVVWMFPMTDDDKKPKPGDRSNSGRLSLVFSGASHHFGQREFRDGSEMRHFNEFNPGAGVELGVGKFLGLDATVSAGFYKNSVYRTSKYVAVGLETNGSKFLGVGIDGGLLTGYPDMKSTLLGMPLVAIPHIRIGEADKVNLKVEVIPPLKNITPMTIGMQVRVPIK